MRNFKRTLALVLAVIMVIGTFATVSAASNDDWYKAAVEKLEEYNIATIGKTAAEPITRNEFVLWVSKIESKQLSDNAWKDEVASAVFTDVNDTHNKAAIAYAHNAGYIIGNGDGTFAPDKTVSFAEASAVIVRLMGYESKVKGLAGAWDTNYILAASNYCRAFDQVFYKNVDTMNPDYELCKGEAAYILATIMNAINRDQNNPILTADDIDLGAWFEANKGPVAKENVYYITNLDRVSLGTSNVNSYIGGLKNQMYTNVFDKSVDVTLASADAATVIEIKGTEFLKALRVHLGLAPTPDVLNEEPEINVYNYVNVGTLLNVKVDTSKFAGGYVYIDNYKDIAGFEINTNSVVVDTYLQLSNANRTSKMVGDINVADAFYGYSIANKFDSTANSTYEQFKPVLPSTYDATMATSWTNLVVDVASGDVTAATLNFKGVAYQYGEDIVAYDATWTEMTADDAVKALINAAQGECYAVFNDVDEDGLYDTVYVKESHPFAYASEANLEPASSSTVSNILTSISGGEVVYANTALKNNTIGSVIYNRTVGYPNNGNISSSDAYNLTVANTGKMQLVLCASNAHPAGDYNAIAGGFSHANDLPLYYTVVDLASFYTGIIEEVAAANVDGYYTARIRCTDDVIRTVYIPVEASASVELDVTVGGATAAYTFNSSTWFTFLEDTKNAAIAGGIFQDANVKDPAYLTWAAAWMAGKYVEFATNENNEVICILGTDASTGTTGFVTGVAKTETGDNTYNVSIAVTTPVTYKRATNYFTAANPITEAAIRRGNNVRSGMLTNTLNIVATQSVVADDGNTYYNTAAGNDKLWASTSTLTADTYFVCLVDVDLTAGTAKIGVNADGYFADKKGNVFVDTFVNDIYNSVSTTTTVEVRAAASGIFDWANYNVYNQIFKGVLLDPNVATDKKVEAGSDLIYVTVMKDAGSNYILYNSASASVTQAYKRSANNAFCPNSGNSFSIRWYAVDDNTTYNAEASWYGINDGYILSIEEVEGSKTEVYDNYGHVCGYEALYNAKVGFGPYYDRAWNSTSKSYTYDLKFTEVVELQNFVGYAEGVIDTTKTLMIALHENQADASSNQVVADTAEEKKLYTIANGFYVDKDGKVFIILNATIVYKTDDKGNLITKDVVYDYETATAEVVVGNDVSFEDTVTLGLEEELAPYATLTVSEKPRTAEGWFPGSYYVTIDGVNYSVTTETEVVVVTPSANGFSVVTKTIAQLANEGGYFVTEWNAVIGTGNTLQTLAIVGQKAGSTKAPVVTPEPEEDKTRLVYLDGTAAAYIRHDKYSNAWLVVSDKSAYALPTGEEVGAIYRSYPTYAEADNAIKIDLGIEGGKWYIVDENNKIVSATSVELLTGTVTDVKADGTTIATMNGEKNVEISKMDTEFFYFDAEQTVLYVAEDKTDVTIIAKAAYDSLFASHEKAVADAQTAYDNAKAKYDAGNLSDERLAYYETALTDAKAALVNAKAESLDKYFNGQFWGFANSPLYQYVAMAQGTFQEGKPTLTFNYVIIDEVLCVFTDSFSFDA